MKQTTSTKAPDQIRARSEAAARALASMEPGEEWPTNEALGGSLTGTRDDEYRDGMLDQAKDALAAADAVDAEQGIHRIKVDDDTARTVALALGNFDYRGEEFDVNDYMRQARQVLAALVEAKS